MSFKESWSGFSDKFMKFFGLRPFETGSRMIDPYNIYLDEDDPNDKRALRVAMLVALLFHVLLFVVRFAADSRVFIPDNRQLITLRNLAGPQMGGGGGGRPKTAAPRAEVPKPKPVVLPFPDPTPDEPEPLYEPVTESAPQIVAQVGNDFSIGEATGPAGSAGLGGSGRGGGMGDGIGRGTGSGIGDGVYGLGGGVKPPVAIYQPLPLYTEEARRARVEGIVLLQAIIRKDGSVDSFRVIRGLGYGLDESAINTIATKWRFKPGTLSGQPVDVQANIEVTFRLY
jgi:periplasmic protein TonB